MMSGMKEECLALSMMAVFIIIIIIDLEGKALLKSGTEWSQNL